MSQRSQTISLNSERLIEALCSTPPGISWLIKGGTGVGKSSIVHQIGELLGTRVLDIRLAVRQESDVLGIPDMELIKTKGVAVFTPPSWLRRATEEGMIIFLDEVNRAMAPMRNAAFQLVLDYCFGEDENGEPRKLHPNTRIICAINEGADFVDVEELDLAFLRRFFVAEIELDIHAWRRWAMREDENGLTNVDPIIVDFCLKNENFWAVRDFEKEVVAGSTFPTPATWHKLSQSLRYMGCAPTDYIGRSLPSYAFDVCGAAVGTAAANAFERFVASSVKQVDAKDLFDPNISDERRQKLLTIVQKSDIAIQAQVRDTFINNIGKWVNREKALSPEQMLDYLDGFLEALNPEHRKEVVKAAVEVVTDSQSAWPELKFTTLLTRATSVLTDVTKKQRKGI